MQEFIYLLRVKRLEMLTENPLPQEDASLQRHFSYLQKLTKEGRVRLAGRTSNNDASTFGLVILTAASRQEAAELMAADPAVAEGVMSADLYPFRIAFEAAATAE